MNLGKYIAEVLLEQDKPTIALFPGAFKPPHKGHFEVVKKLLQNADEVVILVSPKTREGITADESIAVWDIYKTLLDGSVEVKISSESPVKEAYNVVKNNPDTNFILAAGRGEVDRFKSALKFPNVKVVDAGNVDDINATGLRNALQSKNMDAIAQSLPTGVNTADFMNAIGRKPIPAEDEGDTITLAEIDEKMYQNVDGAYEQIVKDEEDEIQRTAQTFNVPIPDMEYAFIAGDMVVLTDAIWSKLENSDSYQIQSLEQAVQLAKKYKKDWEPTLRAIKDGNESINPPLVLNYDKDKYYLVGGNTRLMFYKALGITPKVLLGTLNLGAGKQVTLTEALDKGVIKKFLGFAVKELKLKQLPSKLTLSQDVEKARHRHTFGTFDPNDESVWVYVGNRNTADILRTLAHELVHRKQAEDGRLNPDSGETGSDIENEANAQAGVLLRNFGKQHEEIYQ